MKQPPLVEPQASSAPTQSTRPSPPPTRNAFVAAGSTPLVASPVIPAAAAPSPRAASEDLSVCSPVDLLERARDGNGLAFDIVFDCCVRGLRRFAAGRLPMQCRGMRGQRASFRWLPIDPECRFRAKGVRDVFVGDDLTAPVNTMTFDVVCDDCDPAAAVRR